MMISFLRYGVFSPSRGLFLGVFWCLVDVLKIFLLALAVLVLALTRCNLLGRLDEVLQVCLFDESSLASTLDLLEVVSQNLSVQVPLLHQLRRLGAELGGVSRGRGLPLLRVGRLHVLEADLPVGARPGNSVQVHTVVAGVDLSLGGRVHRLGCLSHLGLNVLEGDLPVLVGALEVFGWLPECCLGCLARRVRGPARDFLGWLLRLDEFLRQEPLLLQELEGVAAAVLVLGEEVDDLRDGGGGSHE